MTGLIDADALKDTLGVSDNDIEFAEMLDEQPTVEPSGLTGWICPICGRGLSPFTYVCPCNGGKGWEITCG